MARILAIYGSPRRKGNTSLLLKEAVAGAIAAGAQVDEIILRDLTMAPCLEIYGCKKDGRCVIQDDFQRVYELIESCDGFMLASPIFFYTVSAHTKIFMDRCQSFWVKRYWIDKETSEARTYGRKGIFIAAGGTKGKRLFEGAQLTARYFYDALDAELWRSLLYPGLEEQGAVQNHPQYLEEAYEAGKSLAEELMKR
ncbi:MAG TPA: flavodoxin family protein [Thermodesulfobacteriota bacterium]|nr:flavodoxin family protein [Thermodesulfobacteriota bacterium]HNU71853.1 flavodoxin family protein [Thermodesulfobacteriota bacterium]HOC38898.1 flavodoxin family protein [Thermodesulfobacteriota bacterium]